MPPTKSIQIPISIERTPTYANMAGASVEVYSNGPGEAHLQFIAVEVPAEIMSTQDTDEARRFADELEAAAQKLRRKAAEIDERRATQRMERQLTHAWRYTPASAVITQYGRCAGRCE